MRKLLIVFIISSYCVLLASCGSKKSFYELAMEKTSWLCFIDAIGEEPTNKTYYAEARFPEDVNSLIEKDYLKKLEITLTHLGYTRVDSSNAALKIAFGYELGDVEQRSYTYSTPVFQYTPPTTITTNSTIKNAKDKTLGNINSTTETNQKYGTISYAGERTNTEYEIEQPITFVLDAFEIKTKEPIWSLRLNDKRKPIALQNLRTTIKYYLLCMYPYIGKNTGSLKDSQIFLNDERLKWFEQQIQE